MPVGARLLLGSNNPHKAREISALLKGLPAPVVLPRELGIYEEAVEEGDTFEVNALLKARFFSKIAGLPCLADDSGLMVDALGGRPGVFSSRYAPTDAERIARLLEELRGVPESKRSARFLCAAALVVPAGWDCETPRNAAPMVPPGWNSEPPGAVKSLSENPLDCEDSSSNAGGTPAGRAGKMPALRGFRIGSKSARGCGKAAASASASPLEIVEIGVCEGAITLAPRGSGGFGYDPVFYLGDVCKTMAELSPEEKNARSHRGQAFRAMEPHLLRLFSDSAT